MVNQAGQCGRPLQEPVLRRAAPVGDAAGQGALRRGAPQAAEAGTAAHGPEGADRGREEEEAGE